MPNLTLSIPNELKNKLERFPEINWSEVARQAFAEKLSILEKMQELFSKSRLREKETTLIGRQAKQNAWKHHHAKH
jgi:hypothetical protein